MTKSAGNSADSPRSHPLPRQILKPKRLADIAWVGGGGACDEGEPNGCWNMRQYGGCPLRTAASRSTCSVTCR